MLLPQLEFRDDGPVTLNVGLLEVIQQLFALTHEAQEALLGGIVLFLVLEVLRQVVDAERKQCNLGLR